jgi:O-antigen ligase
MLLALRIVANTASRGGLLTICVYATALWFSAKNKLKVGVIAFVLGMVVFASASKPALLRYKTILPFISIDSGDEQHIQDSAEASTTQRRELLMESLELTMRNPVLGVGPGTYQSAAAAVNEQEGRQAIWHESHNTYTQVSSESGIVGFILYVIVLIGSFTAANRVRRRTAGVKSLEPINQTAVCLLLMLTCFALNASFGSLAYLPLFPFIAALAGALEQSARGEIAAWEHSTSLLSAANANVFQSELARH